MAGINRALLPEGRQPPLPPPATAIGALLRALREGDPKRFDPVGIQFGLLPPLAGRHSKKDRKKLYAERALEEIDKYSAVVI